MSKPFFITTAIDYTNGAPHIGHAYEKVLADVIARYHRLKGGDVFFLTGVDQHGQKVQQSAEKQGVPPQEFVNQITAKFKALWEKLEISYNRPDGWAETTNPLHKNCVQGILKRLWDGKQLYKDKQGGYYSVRQEQFLTDKERGPDGEFGPEWGEVEFREEENYFFKLAEHKDWLLALIDKRDDLVTPAFRRGELRNAVEKLTGDLCVSRPKARLSWGIEFSFDPEYVTYVWFDALVNYISFAGYEPAPEANNNRFFDLWPALHVIGKDIMIPAHGVYWPIMLKALGFTDDQIPPLLVHGWWNIRGKGGESEKMSKSLGNVVDPDVLADKYGAEALRYYLMSDITTGRDADFSEERLIQKYNTDLANGLGNLLNRSLNMTQKYREGTLINPPLDQWGQANPSPSGSNEGVEVFDPHEGFEGFGGHVNLGDLRNSLSDFKETYSSTFEYFETSITLLELSKIVTDRNQMIDRAAPWKIAKEMDKIWQNRLDAILYCLAESLRIIAILISPVLPKAAHGIFDQLQWKLEDAGKEPRFVFADAAWGGLPDGHVVGKPVPLFPRIEDAKA